MADKYLIKNVNHCNYDLLSDAKADLYMELIKESDSPDKMYDIILKSLYSEMRQNAE